MDVRFCIGRNLRREAQTALEGILIRSNARSPKRARKTRAFRLTLTYMEVGISDKWLAMDHFSEKPVRTKPLARRTESRGVAKGVVQG